MTSNRTTDQLAGILLTASFLMMVAHIVADVVLGHGRTSTFFVFLYAVSAALTGPALFMSLRRHDAVLAMFSGFSLSAHGLLTVLTAVMLLVGLHFPQAFTLFGAEAAVAGGAASPFELMMDKTGKSAYAFFGLGLGLAGLLVLRCAALPRWIGWSAASAGLSGMLVCMAAVADVFAHELAEVVFGVAVLANLVVLPILGIRLIMREPVTPAAAG